MIKKMPMLSQEILTGFLADEQVSLAPLLKLAALTSEQYQKAERMTQDFVTAIRHPEDAPTHWLPHLNFDAFLNEYGLNTDEGVSLMCLAEALLRIPDQQTALD
ncbi:MAG TPA: hypothetical protein VFV48_06325, partial [Pseudomonadales bacterium]|nr:hypothetical protein [Pseudomonadales bacterium]